MCEPVRGTSKVVSVAELAGHVKDLVAYHSLQGMIVAPGDPTLFNWIV